MASPGACSARASRRGLPKWPTTSVTWPARRPNWASRPARTKRSAAPAPPAPWAWRGRCAACSSCPARAASVIPPCPRRGRLAGLDAAGAAPPCCRPGSSPPGEPARPRTRSRLGPRLDAATTACWPARAFNAGPAGFPPHPRRGGAPAGRALFDVCAGFVYAQVLGRLASNSTCSACWPRGRNRPSGWRGGLTSPADAATRLLLAACSLRLVSRRGGRFGLGVLGAAMARQHPLWPPWCGTMPCSTPTCRTCRTVALLRGQRAGSLGRFWPYAAGEPADAAAVDGYSALMAESQALVAADVLDAAPLATIRCLMDVGGGDGAFLLAAAARAPAPAADAVRPAAGGRAPPRPGSHRPAWLPAPPWPAAAFAPAPCPPAPTRSRWCGSCTTTTTRWPPTCCNAPESPCRQAGKSSLPSQWLIRAAPEPVGPRLFRLLFAGYGQRSAPHRRRNHRHAACSGLPQRPRTPHPAPAACLPHHRANESVNDS